MSVSVIGGVGDVPSFLVLAPAFSFFEQAIQGQLVNFEIFNSLGGGWYQYKQAEIDFSAPGWLLGYGAEDVERTPPMVRTVRYHALGIRW